MQPDFVESTRQIRQAYESFCKPVCNRFKLPIPALMILDTLTGCPDIFTAKDICDKNNLKPNLISFHIDKLVTTGYLERRAIDGNRRSVKLVCTKKAGPVIQQIQEKKAQFIQMIWSGISDEETCVFAETIKKLSKNAQRILNKQKGDNKFENF